MPVDETAPVDPVANEVYLRPPVTTVDEAIERMDAVTRDLEMHAPRRDKDGVACFNYLYTVITKRVRDSINDGFFQSREFLSLLDIAFANRYFDALRNSFVDPPRTPRSWNVLVERRSNENIESIQFAVAGVNAHVNFDLALALLTTIRQLGTEPNDGTQRADYLRINEIFSQEMATLRQHYQDDVLRVIDDAASPVLDLVGDWSIEEARDAAWEIAEHFWILSRFGIGDQTLTKRLDKLAALGGHLLLTPI